MCSNNPGYRKLCDKECAYCFDKSFASHAKAHLWSTKNPEPARMTFKTAGVSRFFNCEKCSHEFECRVADMKRNKGCGYCDHKKLCECAKCFPKSFASHPKAEQWIDAFHDPRFEFLMSNIKRWFECETCHHKFDSSPANVVNGSWCPFCSTNGPGKLCDDDCKMCFDKSFASHEKASFWLEELNKCEARSVKKTSNSKFWFKCGECEHLFESSLDHISFDNQWCPYCAIPSRKKCENDCKPCFLRSFASHERAVFWSKNNPKLPHQVAKWSHDHYLFICTVHNYEFKSRIDDITKNGSWCPLCATPSEAKLFIKLRAVYPTIIHQFRVEWCKRDRCLPFDFALEEHKIIIELDGPQHFRQVSNWEPPEQTQEVDLFKMKCVAAKGFSVIRIAQEEYSADEPTFEDELMNHITSIITGGTPKHIFMSKKGEYDAWKRAL